MNHSTFIRDIILKHHRGEPLTKEEQAILDHEMAQLPAGKVWERIRSHVERDHGAVIRPWYTRWPAMTAAAAAVAAFVAVGLYRYQQDRGGRAGKAGAGVVMAMQPVWRPVAPGHYYAELAGPEGVIAADSAGGGQSVPYPVALPDGSTVTLSYRSSIRYVKAFVRRTVDLSGEACFQVARKEAAPFAVKTGEVVVDVLGTEFNWMHYPGVPDEVTLLTGKIRLSVGKLCRELRPAERAVIREGSPVPVQVAKMRTPAEALAWMDPQPSIKFDNTDLYTVIERLAQYYNVGFSVAPELRSGSPITGTLFLRWSLEQNRARLAEMLQGYAQIKVAAGMIEVTK